MTDTSLSKPISGLDELLEVTGDELIAVVSEGKTKRVRLNKLKQPAVTKETLGLDKVDNTSDLDKPVSTAQRSALNQKADVNHTHEITDVNGLPEALNMLAEKQHSHNADDIVNFGEKVLEVVNANIENLDLSDVVRTGQMQW